MKKRRCKWGLAWLLYLGLLSIAVAGTAMAASQENEPAQPKEATMNLAMQAATESATIPAIDASVPTVLETASFGLG
jgi:hypothetical protein